MKHYLHVFFALGLLAGFWTDLAAQTVKARLEIDTNRMMIGEHLTARVVVEHPPTYRIEWPLGGFDSLGQFEVLREMALDTTQGPAGDLREVRRLTLTTFDTGMLRLGPVSLPYTGPGVSGTQTVQTGGALVMVNTVAVDPQAEVKDIKPIFDAPLTWVEILGYSLLGLALLALIGGGIWYLSRKKRQPATAPAKPKRAPIPAHEVAMRQLAKLESRRLWQQGEVHVYYDDLTDIIRAYIEAKFQVPAMESVTHEILYDMKGKGLRSKQMQDLRELLQMADLAKFAKSTPGERQNLDAMETARQFVKETKGGGEEEEV